MNNKKFLLASVILLLFIITLSSVNAGEINNTEDLTVDNGDAINLNQNNEELLEDNTILTNNEELEDTQSENPNENDAISDSNSITVEDKTFSGVQNAIDDANEGDTIILDGNYSNDGNVYIKINKSLNFFGINTANLDANGLSGIFLISAKNKNISFKNISFRNGVSYSLMGSASAIFEDISLNDDVSNFFIENCSFVNNSATDYENSVVCIHLGSVVNCSFVDSRETCISISNGSINGCTFVNNSKQAISHHPRAKVGYTFPDAIDIINSSFVNVYARYSVVNIVNGSIFNSNFTNISFWDTTNAGELQSIIYNTRNCSIVNSSFVNNYMRGSGAAIRAWGNCSIYGCDFVNNSAINGGAIYVIGDDYSHHSTSLIISNSNFIDNHAVEYGGAILINNNNNSINISNCNFKNNAAKVGGAIYWSAENGRISNCNFTNNSAEDSGGAIYLDNNTNSVNILDSSFMNNSVSNSFLGINRGGGAISLLGKGIHITNCYFIFNLAKKAYGGAIFSNTTKFNDILGKKGLLYSSSLSANDNDIIIDESTFQGNEAYEGTAIYTEEEMSIIFNNFFYVNGDDLEKFVYGMSIDQLSTNEFTQTKLNASVNSNNIDACYGESVIGSVSSVNAMNINLVIVDMNNNEVYNSVITANGEFVVPNLAVGTYVANFTTIVGEGLYIPSSCKTTIIITPAKSSVSASAVTSYYGKTFSVNVNSNNATSIKYSIKNSKGTVVKSGTINAGASITGLKFAPGTYTLSLTANADGNHTSSSATSKITVNKATATITANALTTYYNSGKTWSITLKDTTNNKLLTSQKLTLKVYTGSKYKTYAATTNAKGVATFKASTLTPGSHKVIISYSNSNYNTKAVTTTLKVNKMALSYKIEKSTQMDGAGLHIFVSNKATKKLINKIKVKLLVYTGKKYNTINLVSGKYSNKGNGYIGYAVKGPVYSVGTHTVKIMAGDKYHSGTLQSTLVLKSTVKKYGKKTIIISNGKRSVK